VEWRDFDQEVLGAAYLGHTGPGTAAILPVAALADHPILRSWPNTFASTSTLYQFGPLAPDTHVLLRGTRPVKAGDQPVAWVRQVGASRRFYTSLGGPDDFAQPAFTQLLRQALLWCLAPPEPAP
jgi:type 1 glutamine amidotransferase